VNLSDALLEDIEKVRAKEVCHAQKSSVHVDIHHFQVRRGAFPWISPVFIVKSFLESLLTLGFFKYVTSVVEKLILPLDEVGVLKEVKHGGLL
jgi:hypothetical protein